MARGEDGWRGEVGGGGRGGSGREVDENYWVAIRGNLEGAVVSLELHLRIEGVGGAPPSPSYERPGNVELWFKEPLASHPNP